VKKTIGIIGGDLRQRYLANVLEKPVVFFANESINERETVIKGCNLSDVFLECDIIIAPIPFSRDKKHVYSKYFVEVVSIESFMAKVTKENIIIGGPFNHEVLTNLKNLGATVIDITDIETFKMKNAIPTSEGVVAELIHKLDCTIHQSKGLILGYGYCGKRMAKNLNDFGASIDIYTVNPIEERAVENNGFGLIRDFLPNKKYDFIINTIPKLLINEEKILECTSLFIDITEAYQMDHDCFLKMRGIPGRFSPRTAGIIIGEILNELIKSVVGEND
jgi:dipicolinate synthase subunit A